VVVEAAPPVPLVIAKAKLLLEFLIIALDPPSQFCQIDQVVEGDILGQSREPTLGRFGFARRPLDQQPLFGAWRGQLSIAMRWPYAASGKARGEPVRAPFAPSDRMPRCGFRRSRLADPR
jgi:hypothetical protein